MSRSARVKSPSDVYHVMLRGVGRQIIFEDNEDRLTLLRMLVSSADSSGISVYAYCLMSNHFHLLVYDPRANLSNFIQSIASGYAVYFNKRHDRVGHVFQGRFRSEAVDTDEYLLTVVYYIHNNPLKEGLSNTFDYPWSSYGEYTHGASIIDSKFVLDQFDCLDSFVRFHNGVRDISRVECFAYGQTRLSDSEARVVAEQLLGGDVLARMKSFEREKRNANIALLRRNGLSARQVERLTGIGRGIVSRVKKW